MKRQGLVLSLCVTLLAGLAWQFSGSRRQAVLNRALANAVAEGRVEEVGSLIREGADVHTLNSQGESLLFSAESVSSPPLMLMLVQAGVSADQRDAAGLSILHRAARRGAVQMLREILALGLPVDLPDGRGRSPLAHALRGSHFPASYFLLEHGANVRASEGAEAPLISLLLGDSGTAPLVAPGSTDPRPLIRRTVGHPIPPRVKRLIGHKATQSMRRPENRAWLDGVRLLLAAGADARARDAKGRSVMELAIAERRWKTAALLVSHLRGWNDRNGSSVLHVAARCGDREGVEALYALPGRAQEKPEVELLLASWVGDHRRVTRLLETGVNPNSTGVAGATPLVKAAGRGDAATVTALLKHGARPNDRANGETPLYVAAAGASLETVELLLKAGASVNARSSRGETPLHGAVAARADSSGPGERYASLRSSGARQLLTVRLLLKHGANPNAVDTSGATPLQALLASGRGSRASITRSLLANGVRVRSATATESPLFAAVQQDNLSAAKMLLDRCAPVNERSPVDGATPLWRAATSSNVSMMVLLCDYDGRLPHAVYWQPAKRRMRVIDILRTWPATNHPRLLLEARFPQLRAELSNGKPS